MLYLLFLGFCFSGFSAHNFAIEKNAWLHREGEMLGFRLKFNAIEAQLEKANDVTGVVLADEVEELRKTLAQIEQRLDRLERNYEAARLNASDVVSQSAVVVKKHTPVVGPMDKYFRKVTSQQKES